MATDKGTEAPKSFPSLYKEENVSQEEFEGELERIYQSQGLKYCGFDPSHPMEHESIRYALGRALQERDLPTQSELGEMFGVAESTVKGWCAGRNSSRHRRINSTMFSSIITASIRYRQISDTAPNRMKVACAAMGMLTPSDSKRMKMAHEDRLKMCKLAALYLRAAALDDDSFELLSELAKRLLSTSDKTKTCYSEWSENAVGFLDDGRDTESITFEEYFSLVDSAEESGDISNMVDLWRAQPGESTLGSLQNYFS